MKGITQLQVHNLEGRIGTELIKSDLTSREIQRFFERKKDQVNVLAEDVGELVINRVRGLYVGPNEESFTLYGRSINHDRSVDELVEVAKRAGWWVRDNWICNSGKLPFDGRLKRQGIHKVDLTISTLRSEEDMQYDRSWRTGDIKNLSDARLLAFDLAELIEFIPYRDELLEYDVFQINALGSRFCGLVGRTDISVACLKIRDKQLELQPVRQVSMPGRRRWMPWDWFGICNDA